MSVVLLPFLLLIILLGTLWFHDGRYQQQEAHAGNRTKPML